MGLVKLGLSLPSLTLKESAFFSTTCALVVHAIYKKHEIWPSSYLPTVLLLLVPPTISTGFYRQSLPTVWISLLASFTLFYFVLGSSIIIYRLSPTHPLHQYPGPLGAKVSKLWMMRVAATGKLNEYIKKLHDEYGPYVRIGPNEISCTDMSVMHDMFGPSGMPKGPLWDARRNPDIDPPLIALRDLHEHGRQRKPWNRAFSTSAVKDYEPVIAKRAIQLADALERVSETQSGRRTVDLSEWFGYFAFDFMGDMAFGGGFELMRDGDKDGIWKLMEARIKNLAFFIHIPWAAFLLLKFPTITGSVRKFRGFTEGFARKRLDLGSMVSRKDLYYHLTNEDGAQRESLTLESMVANGELAIVAGSDTTANTLSGIFFYLLTHVFEFERLREEVDRVFPRDEGEVAVDASSLASKMPILNAVINEALRLQPAVMTSTQRAPAEGSGGHWLGQRFVSEGTAVIAPIYTIHRDPSNFAPFPDEFHPDRWLHNHPPSATESESPDTVERKVSDDTNSNGNTTWYTNTAAFMPFSTGPANCAGKNLALAELRAVVAVLVQRFDVAFADGYDASTYKEKLGDRFITQVGELTVTLNGRK